MPKPLALFGVLALLVAAAVALDLPSAAAQSDEQSGRIVARRLDDGRTEFGWQPARGERVLPTNRYFPADAQVDRWLNSSPVEVDGAEIGRINARLTDDGKIEFAFTPTDGERILTDARYFPADARSNRWLRSTRITIGPPDLFTAVSTGGGYVCGLRESGAIECWGSNHFGQTDAPAGSFSAVSAGYTHTCAIHDTGEAECWGNSRDYGQTDAPEGTFTAVSVGGESACAIRDTGEIACWGSIKDHNVPPGSFTVVSIAQYHACAIAETFAGANTTPDTGEIECWGDNNYNQLNAPAGRFAAVLVTAAPSTCAVRDTGEIACWGRNEHGQTDTPDGSFLTAITRGSYHTCAIRDTGEIACWGISEDDYRWYGQTDAPEGTFTAISAGSFHTCGLRTNGEIACWGQNDDGQTGAPEGTFTAISAGSLYTCGLRTNGEIACWGQNDHGQTDAPVP